MKTQVVGPEKLDEAIASLRGGALVAFPTETVYGLGADALNAAACHEIFAAKGRPADNPLIVHVAWPEQLESLSLRPVPDNARKLVQAFWPGPLTVVIPSSDQVPEIVRGGLATVAVRCPSHPVAHALIAGLGHPVAAPSANRSGRPSPTVASDVLDDLQGRIPLIVDGGPSGKGLESTVVDCSVDPPILLRPGALSWEDLVKVIPNIREADSNSPARSPGMKYRHYSPAAPLLWLKMLNPDAIVRHLQMVPPSRAVVAPEYLLRDLSAHTDLPMQSLGMTDDDVGHHLYRAIREADRLNPQVIVVVWDATGAMAPAIANRLRKAATKILEMR